MLVVFGAGGHGKVVCDILLAAGEVVDGFLDGFKPAGSMVLGLPVLGDADWLDGKAVRVALGIGDNQARERLASECERRGATLIAAVHPRAVVSRSAVVERGSVVMALAVINPDARIGKGAIINTAAVIEHDCEIGDFAHVSPNAAMGGACRVGRRAHLGVGATMLPGRSVGEDAIVGGGALVARDVIANAVVRGVPAR